MPFIGIMDVHIAFLVTVVAISGYEVAYSMHLHLDSDDQSMDVPLPRVADGPVDCDNGTSFCPAGSSCCKSQYSPSHWGCLWNSACCNLGPAKPPSTTLPNCIVLGDSVSIGYTPDVVRLLSSTCQVQHTPWDVSDGGAGATSYALACLDVFLRTAHEQNVTWDVIFFNFGLHNLNNASEAEDLYSQQLTNITTRLLVAGKKVVYGLTTPFMPDYRLSNHVVEELNERATKIMQSAQPAVPVVDLYSVVTKACGSPPYVNCSICRAEPCSYHYNAQGSSLLAAAVSTAIKGALQHEDHATHHTNDDVISPRDANDDGHFTCDGNMTWCPQSSACCNTSIPVHFGCTLNGQCCRPGPKDPPSSILPNCLIMGDSVSDGYTRIVTAMLNATCAVQHTPWMWGGSADSTGYAVACLDHFLVTDRLQAVDWDVVFFNFGLHNLDNATAAEQLYGSQLANITERLLKAGKKVAYGLTTPYMPDYTTGNHVVEQLNTIATSIMKKYEVPMADLYGDIVSQCGPLPYVNCSICAREPCSYHYQKPGYEILAKTVSSAIKSLLP